VSLAPPSVDEVLRLAAWAEEELLGPAHAEAAGRIRALGVRLGESLDWAAENDPERGLALASALWRYWALSGELAEGRQQLRWLLGLVPALSVTRLHGQVSSALLASLAADDEEAQAAARRAMPLARALDDERSQGYLELVCARSARLTADAQGAAAHAEEALERFRNVHHAWGTAIALLEVARARRIAGRHEEAARLLGEAQLLEENLGAFGPEERQLAQREEAELRRLLGAHSEVEWRRARAPG
jgi:hypothetical protein